VLKRELAHLVRGWDISILATDINRQFLDSARQGRFDDWALRGLPTQVRDDCFRRCDKAWSIVPELREGVTFQHHNLVTQGFPSAAQNLFAFDVIFCRNVMIYFSKEVNRRLVAQFYDTLAPEGWLLVGPADLNQELFRAYHTVNFADVVLYQKAGTAGPTPESRSLNPTLAADRSTGSSQPARAARTANSPAGRLPGPASCPESPLTAAEANQLGATRHGSAPSPTAASKNARPDVSRQIAELCSLADEGHLEQALRCVCGLLRSNGLDPAIHLYHALILEQLGYHQQTERALRHAVYLDRENVMAHYYLGLTAQRQHRWQPAARSFRNVLELLAPRADDQRIPHADDLTVADLKRLTQLHLAQQPGESPERKNTKRPIGARRDCQVNRRPSREPGAGRSPSSDPITSLASQGFRK
jgi:chemotaxis protein methyltransferase CheR